MTQKFTKANLDAGLSTFLTPKMTARSDIAHETFNKELGEGTSHRIAIDHALEAAVTKPKPLADHSKKLKAARKAAGTTPVNRAKKATEPITNVVKKDASKTNKKIAQTKPKKPLTLLVGGAIGLLVAILLALISAPLLASSYEAHGYGGWATFATWMWFILTALLGFSLGVFIQYRLIDGSSNVPENIGSDD